MKQTIVFTLIIMISLSCNSNKPIENLEKYFGTAQTADIGVLRDMPWGNRSMRWGKDFMEFFSQPDEKTRFATIKKVGRDKEGTSIFKFKPTNFEVFFNPFSVQGSAWTFRVLEYDSLWMKIIVDENTLRTCYIKNTIFYAEYIEGVRKLYTFENKFQTWENYFRGEWRNDTIINGRMVGYIKDRTPPLVIIKENPTLYEKINGEIISLDEECQFIALELRELQDEWMYGCILKLKSNNEWKYWTYFRIYNNFNTNYMRCWIRWRDGNRILITTDEFPNIWDEVIRI